MGVIGIRRHDGSLATAVFYKPVARLPLIPATLRAQFDGCNAAAPARRCVRRGVRSPLHGCHIPGTPSMNALSSVDHRGAVPVCGSCQLLPQLHRVDHPDSGAGFPCAHEANNMLDRTFVLRQASNFRENMTDNPRTNDQAPPPSLLLAATDNNREGRQHHPMVGPSDAEKYRWIRANRGNFAIVEALAQCDRDADFDVRITTEMGMCAAGKASYRIAG